MLSMNKKVESYGDQSLTVRYDDGATTVDITARHGNQHSISLRFDADQFDKLVEQYMYLRQYANGRRAR